MAAVATMGAPGRPTERGTPVDGTGRRVDEVAAAWAMGSMGTWKAWEAWEAWVDFRFVLQVEIGVHVRIYLRAASRELRAHTDTANGWAV